MDNFYAENARATNEWLTHNAPLYVYDTIETLGLMAQQSLRVISAYEILVEENERYISALKRYIDFLEKPWYKKL